MPRAVSGDLPDNKFPVDTAIQHYGLPTIRAAAALRCSDPGKATELRREVSPYELGAMGSFEPIHVRGRAYLMLLDGSAAAAEFRKLIDHRGLVVNAPVGALAHPGVARAYALQRDSAKSRAAYQVFFTLWKDADPEIPILLEAKAEYAKLQ